MALCPQLVKLGVSMEFRDSLNKTAIQLQKNLDRRKFFSLKDNFFALKARFDCRPIDRRQKFHAET